MSSIGSKKCILSICDISPLKFGSFEEFLVHLTKKLTEQNFNHVIVFRDFPIPSVEKALLSAGAAIEVIQPSKYNMVNLYRFYSLIKRVRPNIVHFHFYPTYTVVNYIKFIFDLKIVYTDHMGGRKAKTKSKKILRHAYYYLNFIFFDNGLDKIICVSNFVKSKYLKEYGIISNKLHVIYNGINTDKFYKKNNVEHIRKIYGIKDEFVITCVGLRKDKGPHYLLKAAPFILKEIKNIKFVFVGEGEYRVHLDSMIDDLNIRDNVIFAGNVPDLSDIYNISSVVVIPSTFEEAFCFVAVEAMATEAQIVAFDSGAIKEVLYNPNSIVPCDYQLLAAKIIECLKSKDNTKDARKYAVERFPLEKNIFEHVKLYSKLLETV